MIGDVRWMVNHIRGWLSGKHLLGGKEGLGNHRVLCTFKGCHGTLESYHHNDTLLSRGRGSRICTQRDISNESGLWKSSGVRFCDGNIWPKESYSRFVWYFVGFWMDLLFVLLLLSLFWTVKLFTSYSVSFKDKMNAHLCSISMVSGLGKELNLYTLLPERSHRPEIWLKKES